VDARIASLADGEDPDSLARGGGADAIAACLKAAVPAVDYAMQTILERTDRTIPGRIHAVAEATPLLLAIRNSSARDLYAGKLAAALDLDASHVHRALRGAAPQPQEVPAPAPVALPPEQALLLALLADHPGLAPRLVEAGTLGLVEHDGVRRVLARMLEAATAARLDVAAIIEDTSEDLRDAVARQVLSSSFAACPDPERAFLECLAGLQGRSLERRAAELRQESRRAEEAGDRTRARALALQAMDMDRQRRAALEAPERSRSEAAPAAVDPLNLR